MNHADTSSNKYAYVRTNQPQNQFDIKLQEAKQQEQEEINAYKIDTNQKIISG